MMAARQQMEWRRPHHMHAALCATLVLQCLAEKPRMQPCTVLCPAHSPDTLQTDATLEQQCVCSQRPSNFALHLQR